MDIISISGVDGSGKSTQTTLLKNHLESTGSTVGYFHITEFSLATRLTNKGKQTKAGEAKAVTKASYFSVLLRIIFLLIDSVRFELYKTKLENAGTDYLVTDRFFQDSIINILYLTKNPFLIGAAKILADIVPRADQAFYLDLPAETILARDRVPEQGQQYLKDKIALYQNNLSRFHLTGINANQSSELVQKEIQSKLVL